MADIRAFRAYRYDLGRVGALSDVVAPPYDVIDPALQDALYERHPQNVVRLILNKEQPTDSEFDNRYSRAARCLRDWQQEGILAQDSARALYVYHQQFEIEGRSYVRKGFLARVRLEPFGSGRIYPHEETLSGPKADRLKLFRATEMNLSPIFGLFPDEHAEVENLLGPAVRAVLPIEAVDHLGVIHRLWPITDQRVVSAVTGLMAPRPVFIADGHHRYETGLHYLQERSAAGEVRDGESAANFILMMLVSMSDPGLIIMPTHRLVSGLPPITSDRLQSALHGHFSTEIVGTGALAAQETWESIEADGGQDVLGMCTVADGIWHLARLRSLDIMKDLAPAHSQAWQGLAVSILHVLILDWLLQPLSAEKLACRYVHLLGEAVDAVSAGACRLAVLVPPASMQHVADIAGGLEKMPPKSTYFYPKLLSGLVFNSLKVN